MRLKISKENKRFFHYNGEIIMLNQPGFQGVPNDWQRYVNAGFNTFRLHTSLVIKKKKKNPFIYKPGTTHETKWGGWNQQYLNDVQDIADKALSRGYILHFVTFSSPERREDNEWHDHLWNEGNGGFIPPNENGVRGFYKTGNDLQKEILKKIFLDTLPESKYGNILISLNWEIGNGFMQGGREWAIKMIDYLQSFSPTRPYGIGSHMKQQLKQVGHGIKGFPTGIAEGKDYFTRIKQGGKPRKYPLIGCGFHPQDSGHWIGNDPDRKCELFESGQEILNLIGLIKNVCYMVKKGGNPSGLFGHYWKRSPHIKECDSRDYDFKWFKNEALKFNKAFMDFLKDEVDLLKITSRKTTKQINRFERKYLSNL